MLKRIYSLLPPGDIWKLAVLFFMMLIGSVLELVGVGLIPLFVAIIADHNRVLEMPELSFLWDIFNVHDFHTLFLFGVGSILIIYVAKNSFTLFYYYIEGRYLWNRYKFISSNLFEKYMKAPYVFHLQKNSAVVLRNVADEGRYLVNELLAPLIKLSMNTLILLGILCLLLWVEPLISLLVILIIGCLGGVVSYLLKNKIKILGEKANQSRAGIIQSINEGIGGLKEIRVAKKENWFMNQFLFELSNFVKSQSFYHAAIYSNKPIMETISVFGIMLIAFSLYVQGVSTEYLITVLVLFGTALVRMLPAMREIVRDINSVLYHKYSLHVVYEDHKLLSSMNVRALDKNPFGDSMTDMEQLNFEREIRFQNVSFSYPESMVNAVSDISLSFQKGEKIGIAGTTGSGKTTMIDLLLGLLTPDSGEISVDGKNLEMYLKNSSIHIGYVPQTIFFTDDTLLNNITFGLNADKIDLDWVEQCLEIADLNDVVHHLPDGIHTKIGEMGVRLSGGQRQRIGIARALYQKPDLLIFDEATSALDSHTEGKVINSIQNSSIVKTIVMVAHRIDTLQNCDRVYFIEDGKVSDSGTVTDLKKNSAAFRKISTSNV